MKTRTFIQPAWLLVITLFASAPSAAHAAQGYQKQTGDFVTLTLSSTNGPRARSLLADQPAERLTLYSDNQQIALQPTGDYQHLSAFSGKIKAQQDNDEDVIVVKSAQGGFMVLYPARQQIIYQPVSGPQTRLTAEKESALKANVIKDDVVTIPEEKTSIRARALNLQKSSAPAANADIDAEGNYIIDMLIGFSTVSAKVAIDPEAFAFAQVESINQALKNSQIEGIKIRLVGIEIIDKDYPIHGDNLAKMSTAFAKGIEKYSPDIITGFFVGDKATDNASAWASIGKNIIIGNVASPTVLRHEIGHNAGGHHCSSATSSGYAYGWDNGKSKTIMCGNTTGYYSNPELKDKFGLPLGDKNKANMAQVWQEAKVRMSSYRPAIVPLNKEKVTLIAEQRVDLNAANYYRAGLEFKAPENVKKIVIAALHDKDYLQDRKYTLEVGELGGTAPSNQLGYYGSDTQYYPSYSISQPAAGNMFYAGVQSEGVDLAGILLRVWAFAQDLENGGAESGNLSGWMLEQGQFRVVASQDNILPAEGKYYFTGRKSPTEANYAPADSMSQTIAINPLALTPNSTATLTFKSNGWGDGDYGAVIMWAKDKDGMPLVGNRIATEGKRQEWIDYRLNVPLPPETTQVEIIVRAYPTAGEMNDVHFDNFRFTVDY